MRPKGDAREAGIRTRPCSWGTRRKPVDLDPHVIIAFTDSHIAYSLFEGLTKLDGKTSEPCRGRRALGRLTGRDGLHVSPAPERTLVERGPCDGG